MVQETLQPAATPAMAPAEPMQLDADGASSDGEVEQPMPSFQPTQAELAEEHKASQPATLGELDAG